MSATDTLASQLGGIFGGRLKMVATFGGDAHACAVVDTLTADDLDACAAHQAGWKKAGVAPPLLIVVNELTRALDAFPLEFSEIISTRRLIAGTDLFAALTVPPEDLRRACETHARGHLVHLREAYIETGGNEQAAGQLVSAAVVPFRALLTNIARLDGTTVDELAGRLGLGDFSKGFRGSLQAAERLVEYVDRWRTT
jgi:hypothetical protein